MGDGSFGFYSMAFDTCTRHDLPITAVMGNYSNWAALIKPYKLLALTEPLGAI
jgi:thiamine pyrophosphate-dependent acetolactate synthase large subunit-like protein